MSKIQIVTAVFRTPVTSLQGMTRISATEVRLPSGIEWEKLEANLHAQLSVSDKVEDKSRIWSVKLVFKTCQKLDDRGHWAYLCRMSDGRLRLIGSDERPYPVATEMENKPERVSEYQLNEITVNWQSPRYIPYIAE